jgi:hypothetical protein
MKKASAIVILVFAVVLSLSSIARAQEETTMYQTSSSNQFYLVAVKYVSYQNIYQTVADVTTPQRTFSITLGDDIYIDEIVFFGYGDQVFLLGTSSESWGSVIFKVNLNHPEYVTKLKLKMEEYVDGYFVDFENNDLYIATHVNELNKYPAANYIRRWNFESGKLELVKKFGAKATLQFGWYDYYTNLPTLLNVSGQQATVYRINGLIIEKVRQITVPVSAQDFGFHVGDSLENTLIWYSIRHYK